jgi:glycosyltransferase involved in cell wall biosynthesis
MIRVSYLITDSGVGGTEKMLADLIMNLDRSRFSPELIVLKPPASTAKMLSEKGVPVKSIGLPRWLSLGYGLKIPGALFRLHRMLAKSRPDILHCYLFQANLLGRIAARCTGIPVNISSLRVEEKERDSHILFERLSRSLVTGYTAVCNEVRNFGIQKLGIAPEKIITIPNGINPELYAEGNRHKVREELGIETEIPTIGTIGRIHRQKGMDIFIRAAGAIRVKIPNLRVIVVGEGPEEGKLRSLVRELGLSDSVIFTGLRQDIPDLLAGMDLFVLASRWEGMPNVILEAMAAGRAVVASDTGGARELVQQGETGILVPVEDVEALSSAIMNLLVKSSGLHEMGEKARDRVRAHYSLTRMVERTQELYERLMRDVRDLR